MTSVLALEPARPQHVLWPCNSSALSKTWSSYQTRPLPSGLGASTTSTALFRLAVHWFLSNCHSASNFCKTSKDLWFSTVKRFANWKILESLIDPGPAGQGILGILVLKDTQRVWLHATWALRAERGSPEVGRVNYKLRTSSKDWCIKSST